MERIQCDVCENILEQEQLNLVERNILREVAVAGEDALADMIEKQDDKFHPTHHVMFRIYCMSG